MITLAMVLLTLGGACFLIRSIVGPSLADRVIAVDGLVVTMVSVIVLESIRSDTSWFLDAAIVVAFVGFVGAAAGARFIERRGG